MTHISPAFSLATTQTRSAAAMPQTASEIPQPLSDILADLLKFSGKKPINPADILSGSTLMENISKNKQRNAVLATEDIRTTVSGNRNETYLASLNSGYLNVSGNKNEAYLYTLGNTSVEVTGNRNMLRDAKPGTTDNGEPYASPTYAVIHGQGFDNTLNLKDAHGVSNAKTVDITDGSKYNKVVLGKNNGSPELKNTINITEGSHRNTVTGGDGTFVFDATHSNGNTFKFGSGHMTGKILGGKSNQIKTSNGENYVQLIEGSKRNTVRLGNYQGHPEHNRNTVDLRNDSNRNDITLGAGTNIVNMVGDNDANTVKVLGGSTSIAFDQGSDYNSARLADGEDSIKFGGGSRKNQVFARGGNDTIELLDNQTFKNYINGGSGEDTLNLWEWSQNNVVTETKGNITILYAKKANGQKGQHIITAHNIENILFHEDLVP